jgi:hypothetical protein
MNPVVCLVLLLVATHVAAQQILQANLAGDSVELTLVQADDLSPVSFPNEKVTLKGVPTVLTQDTNAYFLLQANGIAPDSESFAAVYELNPTVDDLNKVPVNSTIVLPIVLAGSQLQAKLKNGCLVEFTLHPQLRHSLNNRLKTLQMYASSTDKLTNDVEAQSHLRDLFEWLKQIEARFSRRTEPPLRLETLIAMNEEADALLSMFQGAAAQNRVLSSTELTQVTAIHSDFKTDIGQYGEVLADMVPHTQATYRVTVSVKGASPTLARIVRIYYTYNGLFRSLPATPPVPSYPFDELGTKATRALIMKNYQIWAARDGDPNHPLTPSHLLSIDNASPTQLTVDLSVLKDAQK